MLVASGMQRKHHTDLQLKKFRSQTSAGRVKLKSRHPCFWTSNYVMILSQQAIMVKLFKKMHTHGQE